MTDDEKGATATDPEPATGTGPAGGGPGAPEADTVPPGSETGTAPPGPETGTAPTGPEADTVPPAQGADTVARMRPLGDGDPTGGTRPRREGRVVRITLPALPALPRGRNALTAALVALTVVATVLAVLFGWFLWDRTRTDEAGAEALATARSFAVTVTTYDHRTLDRDFAAVLDGATGEFRDQYSGASTALRRLITEAKAEAHGQVVGAGIQSVTADRVEAVLLVDQSITNAGTPQPRIDRTRIVMTLSEHDGRWLVERLELV